MSGKKDAIERLKAILSKADGQDVDDEHDDPAVGLNVMAEDSDAL